MTMVVVFAILPVAAILATVDGTAWNTVQVCDAETDGSAQRTRMIELHRDGAGIVGWRIEQGGIVNAQNCVGDPNSVVRQPWW